MIVAIIGVDGSGKTTQANLLSVVLRRRGFRVKVTYAGNTGIKIFGRFSLYLSLPIDVLVNRLLKINKKELYKGRYKGIAYIEDLLLFLNYLLLVTLKIIFYEKLYDVVIADRYVHDYIMARMTSLTPYSRTLLNILFTVMPKPNMLIVLDVNEEIAYARKGGEKPLHCLKLLRRGYLKLAEQLKCHIVSSNASILATATKLWCLVLNKLSLKINLVN